MGNAHSSKVHVWGPQFEQNGYRVKEESIYKEGDTSHVNVVSFVDKVAEKMELPSWAR